MVTQKDGGLVSRAVREALGTLVSPNVYGQLVGRALQAMGLSEIPESGPTLGAWISGALRHEIELAVGADAAELVAEQLAPIVAHAAGSAAEKLPATQPPHDPFGSEKPTGRAFIPEPRGRRADLARTARVKLNRQQLDQLNNPGPGDTSRPQARETIPNPPSRSATTLFGASTDQVALTALASYLDGTAVVVPIGNLVSLLDALELPGLREPIVLLDCRRPTVNVTSIAAVGQDLPDGTTMVLWGASEETWRELDRDRLRNCRWVRCSVEATPDDVGSLCAMLIGAAQRA